mmetsp:Transcript_121346/g.278091  ORF Transcript_121346/g.278091 Transcript_121346/m.278091 type:complete len:139 (-) Transcript_121346:223-639(-)
MAFPESWFFILDRIPIPRIAGIRLTITSVFFDTMALSSLYTGYIFKRAGTAASFTTRNELGSFVWKLRPVSSWVFTFRCVCICNLELKVKALVHLSFLHNSPFKIKNTQSHAIEADHFKVFGCFELKPDRRAHFYQLE